MYDEVEGFWTSSGDKDGSRCGEALERGDSIICGLTGRRTVLGVTGGRSSCEMDDRSRPLSDEPLETLPAGLIIALNDRSFSLLLSEVAVDRRRGLLLSL